MAKPVLTDQEKHTIDTITASHSNSFDLTFGDMMHRKYGKSSVESSGKFVSLCHVVGNISYIIQGSP